MSRAQLIKKIIGEAIEEYGFEYTGYDKDENVHFYSFERKNGGVIQDITITINRSRLCLEFDTNVYGQSEVRASNLIESRVKGNKDGLYFEDDEELKQILHHFKEIILQKGFDILDDISTPVAGAGPRKERYRKLFQEHDRLNEEYRKRYDLEETESTARLMKKISEIILENRDREFAEVEELLIGLAAVYADQLIRKRGGEWEWDSEFNSCVVESVWDDGEDKDEDFSENPLATTINYWKQKEDNPDWFLNNFKVLLSDVID